MQIMQSLENVLSKSRSPSRHIRQRANAFVGGKETCQISFVEGEKELARLAELEVLEVDKVDDISLEVMLAKLARSQSITAQDSRVVISP
jgi:hypothetical protein